MNSVLTAGIIAALVGLVGVAAGLGAHTIARHEAQAAADQAAVAGAWAHFRGEDACSTATEVARANGAQARQCLVEGTDVAVAAQVRGAVAWAQAGPL